MNRTVTPLWLLAVVVLLVGGCKHKPIWQVSDEKREIAQLAACMDQDWDRTYPDITPASAGLLEIGEPALPTLLPMMLDERDMVRRRAQYAIIQITARITGRYAVKNQAEDIAAAARFKELMAELGNLQWDAPKEARAAAVVKWKNWLASRPRATEPKKPAVR